MEAGAARNTVPGQFGEWFDGGSLTNRGMYLSPWTGAKYLWAVAETVCGLDGYRTSGRPHIAPLLPPDWAWTAAVRVHWGGRRHSYVIDAEHKIIVGDMDFASADEPYRCTTPAATSPTRSARRRSRSARVGFADNDRWTEIAERQLVVLERPQPSGMLAA